MYILDNYRFDRRSYTVNNACCQVCGLSMSHKEFLRDSHEIPIYFHALNEKEAVIFCSEKHSSDWTLSNKDKIWNRKS